MHAPAFPKPDRTFLGCRVAHRHNQVEVNAQKFVRRFRMARVLDADFGQRRQCFGVDVAGWLGPRADGFPRLAQTGVDDGFGHL